LNKRKSLDLWGEQYLLLILRVDRHVPGYVDAYTGPAGLRENVAGEAPREPAALLADVAELQGTLAQQGYAANREAFLEKQLQAVEAMVRKLAGEVFSYREEVERFFDITPPKVDEESFMAAHGEIDRILPGEGSLAERLAAYRDQFIVPKETARALVLAALPELRRRTRALIALPEDEEVEIRLVCGQPWAAYNWYLGQGRSRIEFNTDLPMRAQGLLEMLAHEAYPGHHTEGVLKERRLYVEQGHAEAAIAPLNTPVNVVAEGIGDVGVRAIFDDAERMHWKNEVLYPLAGLAPVDEERALRLERAAEQLRFVSGNAALLLHEEGRPAEEVVAYIERYALRRRVEAEHSLAFLQSPLFRAYTFCYATGKVLIEQAAARTGDLKALFCRLLTEHWTPSMLEDLARGGGGAP
jgi:hypothetical protein